ncbi:MAG: MFS transporter [Promethearchaeota archaeon]
MGRIASFYGFSEDNERILRIAKMIIGFVPILVAFTAMSSTFYMIFVADTLGGGAGMFMEGLGLIGVLVILQLGAQTLLDYPTGAIGDWIGQRWIISSAFFCYGLTFYLTSILTPTTPFVVFVILYVIWGIAASQESGAWMAWFDNNYRVAMPADEDRKEYGVFLGRSGMIIQIAATASLIPGSLLAVVFSRQWVFQLEAVACVIFAVLIVRFVQDFPEVREARKRPTMSEYTNLLKSGVSFLITDPFVKWFIIGGTLVTSVIIVWGNLILFPFYFLYLITDVGVASFRTILFIPGVFTEERSGVWSRRFDPQKWIPRFRLLQTCGFLFFLLLAIVMIVLPPITEGAIIVEILLPFTDIVIMEIPQKFIIPIVLLLCTFIFTGLFGGFSNILTQRVLLDVIPNRIRNSVYSLMPTVSMILALPQIVIIGFTIQNLGFPISLIICAIVSLVGVLMIHRGLSYPIPIPEEETWGAPKEEPAIGFEVVADLDFDDERDMV